MALKNVWNIFSAAIVVLVVLLAVFLMGSRLIGLQAYTVVSGSMEPTYSVGDLIYVKDVDPDSIKVGDPITFVANEDLAVATHRVVEIDAKEREFTTKGDANKTTDANPVHFNNLIGKPVFSIPLLGYVSAYIQSPPGTYVAIAVGVALILLVFLSDWLIKRKKKAGEDKPEDAAIEAAESAAAEEQNDASTPAQSDVLESDITEEAKE